MDLRSKPDLMVLPAQYQIEAPKDENPEDDPVDKVVVGEDGAVDAAALAEMSDEEMAKVQERLNQQHAAGQPAVKSPGPAQATETTLDLSEVRARLRAAQSVKEVSEAMNASMELDLTADQKRDLTRIKDQKIEDLNKARKGK